MVQIRMNESDKYATNERENRHVISIMVCTTTYKDHSKVELCADETRKSRRAQAKRNLEKGMV
uniref:Uncharacterized protein n=1 Tax=Pristionchus pacificus TaxID=54126 RepID=A0A2A6CW66_PRIPA|eukprot:PDM82287.1 hypothetical protein PRIPAC_36680 [Pristionchus pacificus]